jgi:hypothetical protein
MSSRLTPLDWTLISLIVLFAAFHAAMLTGVFEGEHAIAAPGFFDLSRLPEGNAPTVREPTAADLAEADDSPDLPGRFVPTQGKQHTGPWPLRERIPYCEDDDLRDDCYASIPPTSGLHVPVQRGARLSDGVTAPLPPNPGIYDFDLPREAVPHIQEHAGVFVGYNCESDACRSAVEELETVVLQELSLGERVVMTPFSDLDADTIALASWTRVDAFAASDYDAGRVREFIQRHSCRFDPEGFCTNRQPVT